jgi:DNA-binding NarL/FixJ family response regulator
VERGLTSLQIADELSISKFTVSRHRQDILAKLQVKNSAEACRLAHTLGIL